MIISCNEVPIPKNKRIKSLLEINFIKGKPLFVMFGTFDRFQRTARLLNVNNYKGERYLSNKNDL